MIFTRKMKSGFVAGVALAICLGFATSADASTIIPGTADIFLASQPNGTSASGYFSGSTPDTAPANSPVKFLVTGGTLTFSASGSTSVDGHCSAGADGGCYNDQSGFSPPPASGAYDGPADALVGVFLEAGTTDVSGSSEFLPYNDSFGNPINRDLTSYSPGLGQIFFIGDGLTGTGTGDVQQFTAPTESVPVYLYLAPADSYGSSVGNSGSLTVDVTGATALAVPEPATWSIFLLGFGVIGFVMRSRKHAVTALA